MKQLKYETFPRPGHLTGWVNHKQVEVVAIVKDPLSGMLGLFYYETKQEAETGCCETQGPQECTGCGLKTYECVCPRCGKTVFGQK